MLELEMANDCYNYIKADNSYKQVIREIPFLSRCIDLVLICQNDEIQSIEFKVKKWREAIEQAKQHKLGADKTYICLPKREPSQLLLASLEEARIGLYLYCPDEERKMQEYLPAPKSIDKVDIFNSMLRKTINQIERN